jgi:hypothetical protein
MEKKKLTQEQVLIELSKMKSAQEAVEKGKDANRYQTPAEKGAMAEKWVQDLLRRNEEIVFIDVSSRPYKGDLEVNFKSSLTKIMVEVTDQQTTIHAKDVRKFLQNLDDNSHYHCGVLVAVNGNFDKTKEEFKLNETEKKKPYIYLANLATKRNPGWTLNRVLYLIQAYTEEQNLAGKDESHSFAV